jgi:DNA polymerase zeta
MSKHRCGCCRAEIAAAVTAANPRPVTLKMEKVYQPCILQTKKRYVGFAYETADQTEPFFDAKGIETIRWGLKASRVACRTAAATAAGAV